VLATYVERVFDFLVIYHVVVEWFVGAVFPCFG